MLSSRLACPVSAILINTEGRQAQGGVSLAEQGGHDKRPANTVASPGSQSVSRNYQQLCFVSVYATWPGGDDAFCETEEWEMRDV